MIRTHLENRADATIAALPVGRGRGQVVRHHADRGRSGRVIDFEEKPKTPEKLDRVRTDPSWLERLGHQGRRAAVPGQHGHLPVQSVDLVDLLAPATRPTSARRSSPRRSPSHRVQAHLFDGYWEDIGTIGAFHKANIDLTLDDPPFDFTFGEHPIFTRPRYLPCSRLLGRDGQEQPDLRRLRHRPGHGDRELGDRRPGPDRRQCDDPQHLHHGRSTATSSPSTSPTTPALGRPNLGIGAELGDRERDHRQERTDRPERADRQRGRASRRRGDAHPRDPRQIVVTPKFIVLPDGAVI